MCGQAPENISHIRSECSELAGDEYKVQYDKVGSMCIEHAAGGGGDTATTTISAPSQVS